MTEECTCIFCSAKCPECQSTDIEITFRPEYQLTNDTENKLDVSCMESHIEVICHECGKEFDGDTDGRLVYLQAALAEHLEVKDHIIEIDKHGEIETSTVTWKVIERGEP